MSDVFINFKSEERDGVVAVGTYLSDAAKRLGVKVEGDCLDPETDHECVMKVGAGKTLLSAHTKTEKEQLSSQARKNGERLACQTIIEKPGEVTIMSVKKKEEPKKEKTEEQTDEFRKEFEEMPLEKKIASLVELEAIALGETFSYVLNSPYKAFGKVMDVMAGFGLDMEQKDKDAKRPEEHKNGDSETEKKEPKKTPAKKRTSRKASTSRRKSSSKRPARKTSRKRGDTKGGDDKNDE